MHRWRNGMICCGIFVSLWLMAQPSAPIAFEDDWAFARTALVLADSGHFRYFGWGAPMLGWQAAWGAAFIRLFGFSFDVLRLSTLLLAAASVLLLHSILRRFGVSPWNAVAGALAVALSPLFLPLSASFMTDVPGVFCILLCLWLCLRAVDAGSDRAALVWLGLAALSNDVGGTVRQVIWLGALVMVPCTAWLLRRRSGMVRLGVIAFLVSAAWIAKCTVWFTHQPFTVGDPSIAHSVNPVARTLVNLLSITFCMALLLLPVLAAWLPQAGRLKPMAYLRIVLIAAVSGLLMAGAHWVLPWLGDLIAHQLSSPLAMDARAHASPVIPLPVWIALSVAVVAVALVAMESIAAAPARDKTAPDEVGAQNAEGAGVSSKTAQWLLGPFSLAYVAILIGYGYKVEIVDRHLLLLVPFAVIALLKLYEREAPRLLPMSSISLLGLVAIVSVAGNHDQFAGLRARAAAIEELRTAGIARTSIQGGFAFDGWTQLESGDHAQRDVAATPEGENPGWKAFRASAPCTTEFVYAPILPAIHADYFVTATEAPCLSAARFFPVAYTAWLPPFHREIYIRQMPAEGHP